MTQNNVVPKIDPNDRLADLITNLLAAAGHTRPTAWQLFSHPDVFDDDINQDLQRFLINRAWRQILGNFTEFNTIDIRFCLVDQGDLQRWLELFENQVIPCVVQNDLPPPLKNADGTPV